MSYASHIVLTKVHNLYVFDNNRGLNVKLDKSCTKLVTEDKENNINNVQIRSSVIKHQYIVKANVCLFPRYE